MKKQLAVAIAAMTITGCASTPAVVERVRVNEVRVPVVTRCIDVDKIPAAPKTAMKPEGDVKQLAAGAAVDILTLEEQNAQMRALLNGCAR